MAFDFQEGEQLLINKPKNWTSFDVVRKIRYAIKVKKVGHAGTLDPLATGLIILCTGKKTKTIESLMGCDKEYTGEFFIGATTPSYDLETEVDETFPTEHINADLIHSAALSFIGDISQVPPAHSAIKVNGKRAYSLARAGKDPKLEPRKLKIYEFEILDIDLPTIKFRVKCSKGTYIRSLAYDFGKKLNSGGYLQELTRTKIGEHRLEDAYELEELLKEINVQREGI